MKLEVGDEIILYPKKDVYARDIHMTRIVRTTKTLAICDNGIRLKRDTDPDGKIQSSDKRSSYDFFFATSDNTDQMNSDIKKTEKLRSILRFVNSELLERRMNITYKIEDLELIEKILKGEPWK